MDAAPTPAAAATTEDLNIEFASGRVFCVAELLENILSSVSQIDVFVVQRVSKTFRNTVQGSKVLQRKMTTAIELTSATDSQNCDTPPEDTELSLSSYLHYYRLGNLQLLPLRDQAIHKTSLCFKLHKDKHQPMGWQGKRAVYTTGSWENIELGVAKGPINVRVEKIAGGKAHFERSGTVAAGAVMSDLFELLEVFRRQSDGRRNGRSAHRWSR